MVSVKEVTRLIVTNGISILQCYNNDQELKEYSIFGIRKKLKDTGKIKG